MEDKALFQELQSILVNLMVRTTAMEKCLLDANLVSKENYTNAVKKITEDVMAKINDANNALSNLNKSSQEKTQETNKTEE